MTVVLTDAFCLTMVLWTSHFVLYLGPIICYQGCERQNTIEILIYVCVISSIQGNPVLNCSTGSIEISWQDFMILTVPAANNIVFCEQTNLIFKNLSFGQIFDLIFDRSKFGQKFVKSIAKTNIFVFQAKLNWYKCVLQTCGSVLKAKISNEFIL